MCGLAGILDADPTSAVDRDALERAAELLHRRGPDGSAVWTDPGVGLAHTRLAIIDRDRGAQPMHSEDGRYVVVFNGEIYNHRALRRELEARGARFRTRSDTEVLLHLYARDGTEMVPKLRGMFAFVVWDRVERRALLARDRFGKKPLAYMQDRARLSFASTLDALVALLRRRPDLDPQAIAEYLVLQYVPAPLTPYEGVHKLPPGHLAEWRDGQLQISCYWEPPRRQATLDGDGVDAVRERIADAVKCRLESEVALGVFLSGGLDSSIVVAELAAAGHDVATYSVGFRSTAFDETAYATLVAHAFGTRHERLVADDDVPGLFSTFVDTFDEPFADSSALATVAVAKAARERVTVVLTGDGGDELFGGYARYAFYRRAQQLHRRFGSLSTAAAFGSCIVGAVLASRRLRTGGTWVRDPWRGYRDALFHFAPAALPSLLTRDACDRVRASAPADRLDRLQAAAEPGARGLQTIDQRTYLPDDLLVKMDRASMAFGVEARSPLLDHALAETVARLPRSDLYDHWGGKAVLRRAYASVLPAEILTRPKMGFGVPLHEWLCGELRPQLSDLLLSDASPLRSIVRRDAARALVARMDRDPRERYRVWNLLALAGWAGARGLP